MVESTGFDPHRPLVGGALLAASARRAHLGRHLLSYDPMGGEDRDRTGDLLFARQALFQLSYIPMSRAVGAARGY
jgi:hypothetical protein